MRIKLCNKPYKVHRLVAEAFIPNPNGKPQVNHINSDRADNRVENLEWVTNAENTKHGYKQSLKNINYKNPRIKLTDAEIEYVLSHYIKGSRKFGANALARKFNVSQPTIGYIVKNKMKYLEVLRGKREDF